MRKRSNGRRCTSWALLFIFSFFWMVTTLALWRGLSVFSSHEDILPLAALRGVAHGEFPEANRERLVGALPMSLPFTPLGLSRVRLLHDANAMVNLSARRVFSRTLCPVEPAEKESAYFVKFLKFFDWVFREKFNNLPWWLDEGSLLGVSRAGTILNADDDFDLFVMLPNATSPCSPGTLECTQNEFRTMIHRVLLTIHEAGACIRNFTSDISKFDSRGRLIYSVRLVDEKNGSLFRCNGGDRPAHLHFGMLNANGELETNKWSPPGTHKKDKLPLDMIFPVRRCRMGLLDAPCPNDIPAYLKMRNEGEYVNDASVGNCLLVKKKWKMWRKKETLKKVELLDKCGYNSIVRLAKPFIKSGYTEC